VAFVVVLCLGTIFDHAPRPRELWDGLVAGAAIDDPAATWLRTLWVLAAAWALVRPRSVTRYLLLCGIGSVVILTQLPRVPNHWIVELGIYLGCLSTAAVVRDPHERFGAFRVLLLGSIFAVYFWTFVHKLNTGFLDPATSCSPVFLESLSQRLRLPPPGDGLRSVSVVAVLVTEGLMPALLLAPRLRAIAVLLGIGLHFMFGLFVAGFSVLMWATYFMLLPPTALDRLTERLQSGCSRLADRVPANLHTVPGWARQLVTLLVVVGAILLIKEVPKFRGLTQQETLLLPISVIVGAALVSGVIASGLKLPMPSLRPRARTVALAFPLLLLLNGAVPYFGVRNALAFSMFSNLRTENGESNHLFLPSVVTPFSVLDDQIRVLRSSDPTLDRYARPQHRNRWNWTALIADRQNADFELPFFMLRLRAEEVREAGEPMFSIEYERRDEIHDLSPKDVSELAPVSRVASWIHWSKGNPLPPEHNACMW
jgi:hypothetical protein